MDGTTAVLAFFASGKQDMKLIIRRRISFTHYVTLSHVPFFTASDAVSFPLPLLLEAA